MNTVMREAFLAAKVRGPVQALGKRILKALSGKAGVKHPGRGWNAGLSYRTALKLKADGILG